MLALSANPVSSLNRVNLRIVFALNQLTKHPMTACILQQHENKCFN